MGKNERRVILKPAFSSLQLLHWQKRLELHCGQEAGPAHYSVTVPTERICYTTHYTAFEVLRKMTWNTTSHSYMSHKADNTKLPQRLLKQVDMETPNAAAQAPAAGSAQTLGVSCVMPLFLLLTLPSPLFITVAVMWSLNLVQELVMLQCSVIRVTPHWRLGFMYF